MSFSVAVIATVLNEARSLGDFLDSLDQQSRQPDEVVIVDGGSTDGTWEQLQAWATSQDRRVVLQSLNAGISEGRNCAIASVSTTHVAVTDAGTRARPDWLEQLCMAGDDAEVVGGFFEPAGDSRLERILSSMLLPLISEIHPADFLPSSRSLLVSVQAWRDVGGYPEWLDYCEDLVFDLALRTSGYRIEFQADALVTWNARSSVRAFVKQYYRYARGDGKALLWPRRQVARYSTYLVVVPYFVHRRGSFGPTLLALGASVYLFKFYRRVWARRALIGRDLPCALLLVAPLVVLGDLAKMVGYPVGRAWRVHNPRAVSAQNKSRS